MNYTISITLLKSSVLLLVLFLSHSCTQNVVEYESIIEYDNSLKSFYQNALIGSNENDLLGTWNFTQVELNGRLETVLPSQEKCGYDYFSFLENNVYREVLFTGYSPDKCFSKIGTYTWSLNEGIITLYDALEGNEELVITFLTSDKLIAKIRLDLEGNGTYEVFTFTAEKFIPPPESNDYHLFISRNSNVKDKIQLKWDSYNGYNRFIKYEIFRTLYKSKSSAELIASIRDLEENSFDDLEIPKTNSLSYFIKIYSDEGVIESELYSIQFEYYNFDIALVTLKDPVVKNDAIELNWSKFEGYYFSHYEITVRNFENSYSSESQETSLAIIEDITTTSFSDKNLPYFENPVYSVYSYNIFGYKHNTYTDVNSKTVLFKRPSILDFDVIYKIAVSPTESSFYFYGNKSTYDKYNIYKYNYTNLEIEAVADVKPSSYDTTPIKLIKNELCFKQGREIHMYNPSNLKYQSKLTTNNLGGFSDYVWLKNDIWVVVTTNNIYSYKRSGNTLLFIESKEHYSMYHGQYDNTKIIKLNDNEVLIGHQDEDFCNKLSIDTDGKISEKTRVNIPIRTRGTIFVNEKLDILVNSLDNSSYKLSNARQNASVSNPMFIRGASLESFEIYGTNNDPGDYDFKNYEKKAKILYPNGALRTIDTKGYPMFMFKNYLGRIISISSGLEKSELIRSSPRKNVFVEVVE